MTNAREAFLFSGFWDDTTFWLDYLGAVNEDDDAFWEGLRELAADVVSSGTITEEQKVAVVEHAYRFD